VRINNKAGSVRLTVHDGGHGFPFPSYQPDAPLVAGGQGLAIVAALSETWGVDSNADGCTVWCELAVEQQPAGAVDHGIPAGQLHDLALEMANGAPAPI
jgi:hypothetical protein